jgi:hypothetical protein
MSKLILQKYEHHSLYHDSSREYEVIETEPDTIAHTVYSIVAATLGAPLWKALREHWDSCDECMTGYIPDRCKEGKYIWGLISQKGMVWYA